MSTWLSPEQVAERTPMSRKAVYGAIRRGELRASKRCGRWMVLEHDLDAWVAAGVPEPAKQLIPPPVARPRRRGGPPAQGSLAALRSIEREVSDEAASA